MIRAPSQQQPSPAKNKCQVEPGLRAGKSDCHQNQNPNASARDHTNTSWQIQLPSDVG
ncbi:hypothetical protein [Rhodopirellula europaea]|uniref:hypothetical protein n=1 Tax=Rhodopirellula europaea TaxID=1263866 RepID=UPI00130E6C56